MGKPRNTRKYLTYPEIPEIPGNTREKKRYPEIPDCIFWHFYPTRTWPATRYFVQYPTRPDIEKPHPLGTDPYINTQLQHALIYMRTPCARLLTGASDWRRNLTHCSTFVLSLSPGRRKIAPRCNLTLRSCKHLGRGSNNQNGNLRWYLPWRGGGLEGVSSATYLFWKMIFLKTI